MAISSVSPVTQYLTAVKDEDTAAATYAQTDATTKREIAEFQKDAPSITSASQLLKNYSALQVVLGAYGLSSIAGETAVIRDLLTQDPTSSTSLAAKSGNATWMAFADAFKVWGQNGGESTTSPFTSGDTTQVLSTTYTPTQTIKMDTTLPAANATGQSYTTAAVTAYDASSEAHQVALKWTQDSSNPLVWTVSAYDAEGNATVGANAYQVTFNANGTPASVLNTLTGEAVTSTGDVNLPISLTNLTTEKSQTVNLDLGTFGTSGGVTLAASPSSDVIGTVTSQAATTAVSLESTLPSAGNLSQTYTTAPISIYDSSLASHSVALKWTQDSSNPLLWTVSPQSTDGTLSSTSSYQVLFNSDGTPASVTNATTGASVSADSYGVLTLPMTLTNSSDQSQTVTFSIGAADTAGGVTMASAACQVGSMITGTGSVVGQTGSTTTSLSLDTTLPTSQGTGQIYTTAPVTVYDTQTNAHALTFKWTQDSSNPLLWTVTANGTDGTASVGTTSYQVTFNADGTPASVAYTDPTTNLPVTENSGSLDIPVTLTDSSGNTQTIQTSLGTAGQADGVIVTTSSSSDVSGTVSSTATTTAVTLVSTLPAANTTNQTYTAPVTVYDSTQQAQQVDLKWTQDSSNPLQWTVTAEDGSGNSLSTYSYEVTFNANGTLDTAADSTGGSISAATGSLNLPFSLNLPGGSQTISFNIGAPGGSTGVTMAPVVASDGSKTNLTLPSTTVGTVSGTGQSYVTTPFDPNEAWDDANNVPSSSRTYLSVKMVQNTSSPSTWQAYIIDPYGSAVTSSAVNLTFNSSGALMQVNGSYSQSIPSLQASVKGVTYTVNLQAPSLSTSTISPSETLTSDSTVSNTVDGISVGQTLANFEKTQYENNTANQDSGVGDALYFTRTMGAGKITDLAGLMSDSTLLKVVEVVNGYDPDQFGVLDYDQQVRLLQNKVDFSKLKTTQQIQQYAERYLAMLQINPPSTDKPASMMDLFGGGSSNSGIVSLFGAGSSSSSSSLYSSMF
ncbi:DUF1217 domain-containing protein [Gluconacetobacter takamatsuzukensis]|nr:DUF1217 domain-containing protein [Gluconacetobacter takamatsuzukensis]